jgi:Protein of unknown function (DUF1308)
MSLEDYIEKHKALIEEFEELYEKYKFNDLGEHLKNIRGNFENCKNKFLETNNTNCFNYLNYFYIFSAILKHEKNFVMFASKINSAESNIGKGINNYIVSQNGFRWIKIISKNSDVINNSFDPDYYDNYCISDDVEKFVDDVNNIRYLPFDKKPELWIVFYELPNDEVCQSIKEMGINITTVNKINENLLPIDYNKELMNNITTINLDVNIIITLCSELSNLEKDTQIDIPPEIIARCITGNIATLNQIIDNKNFIVEMLQKYKRRIMCQSAYNKIMEFTNTLSTKKNFSKEIERIKNVISKYDIEIIPDQTTTRIENTKHPNKLATTVFGTGDYYNAVTISGYLSYINYAKQNRVGIAAIICNSVEFSEKYLAKTYK